jgi:pyridoxine kinase
MKRVLSIQSHVVLGHVGNRAAVFPLERMGIEVLPLNTVQFSNHPGYGSWKGSVFSGDHIREIWKGLESLRDPGRLDALLSGYLGTPEVGRVILEIVESLRSRDKEFLYCCDPVIGDYQEGVYVRPGVLEFFRTEAIPKANIIKPNQFEAELLTGLKIDSLEMARKACDALHERGPGIVLMTSVDALPGNPGEIRSLLSLEGKGYGMATPRFSFDLPPHGGGDLLCALFLGNFLGDVDSSDALGRAQRAFSRSIHAVHEVFRLTKDQGSRELAIVGAQEAYLCRDERYFLGRYW